MGKLIKYFYNEFYNPLCSSPFVCELLVEPSPDDAKTLYVGVSEYIGVVQAKGTTNSGLTFEAMELIEFDGENITRKNYSYQICDPDGVTNHHVEKDPVDATILRYDNEPHHEVETHPDHKHIGTKVYANHHTTLGAFIEEATQLTNVNTITFKNKSTD